MKEDDVKEFVDKNYEEFMKTHTGHEGPFELKSEYTLSNGQQVDKVIFGQNKKILALIECKGTVGTNEFVRGFGQTFQGKYQIAENLKEEFAENAKSFLLLPYKVKSKVNLSGFKLDDIKVIFVNENETTTEYSDKGHTYRTDEKWVTVNPYYFRDCSLEGIYIILKLMMKQTVSEDKMNLIQIENHIKFIRDKYSITFFSDIRNTKMVPNLLGFFNTNSKTITTRGYEFGKKSFEDFCKDIVLKEYGEYSRIVLTSIMLLIDNRSPNKNGFYNIKTSEIREKILSIFQNKKITYLFDPDGGDRNLRTVIRMLKTIGSLSLEGNDNYKLNYVAMEGFPFLIKEYGISDKEKMKKWFELLEISI